MLGERGQSASQVELFQQRKPSPKFFSKKEGGAGDNTLAASGLEELFSSCAVVSVFCSGGK